VQYQILQALKADWSGQLVPVFFLNLKEAGLNSGRNWGLNEVIWKREKICLKNLNQLNCFGDILGMKQTGFIGCQPPCCDQ